jgi:hypothetical protein
MFIEEFPGAVSPELCEQIIATFEADDRRRPSHALRDGVPSETKHRSGTMLGPGRKLPAWKALIEAVEPALGATMRAYVAKYPGLAHVANSDGLVCTSPLIERVEPGQGFNWHADHSPTAWERVVAGLLYLKTVEAGGGTEFADQHQTVQPVAGKIVLFPPYWTHFHRGVTPTAGVKYVLSYFWVYKSFADKA